MRSSLQAVLDDYIAVVGKLKEVLDDTDGIGTLAMQLWQMASQQEQVEHMREYQNQQIALYQAGGGPSASFVPAPPLGAVPANKETR